MKPWQRFVFLLVLLLVGCAPAHRLPWHAGLPVPVPVVPSPAPVVEAPAPIVPEPVPQPTRAERLLVRAHFCDLRDADGRTIWSPALVALWAFDRDRFWAWIHTMVEQGATHVVLNVGEGQHTYDGPGVPAINVYPEPDNWADLDGYAAMVRAITETRGATGQGLTAIIFLDGGGPDPLPRITARWPSLVYALDRAGVLDRTILVPAFEPVVGDWRSAEVSAALRQLGALRRETGVPFLIGYHGSPARLVGSSNPLEADDPWQGAEAGFYTSHGGEDIDLALYQTPHGRELYEPCDVTADACWLNRWNDYVLRLGGGYHGWRRVPLVFFEVVAFEAIRLQATPEQAREIATRAQAICDAPVAPDYDGGPVACGFGDGLPR